MVNLPGATPLNKTHFPPLISYQLLIAPPNSGGFSLMTSDLSSLDNGASYGPYHVEQFLNQSDSSCLLPQHSCHCSTSGHILTLNCSSEFTAGQYW